MTKRNLLPTIAWVLTGALIVSMAVFKITCFDVWWHLKTGEYILNHLTVPTHDIFTYTVQGGTWVTHEWFFEVILFLVYRLGALTGVILLNALIVLTGFAFTFIALRRLKIEPFIAVPLVVLAAFLVTFRAFCRPHIVTESLIALYLMVLLSFKYLPEIRTRRNQLWLLLIVQLVWANTHSGGILGIALFVGFILAESIQGRMARRTLWIARDALPGPELLFLLQIAGGLLLVSFINPNFHRALLYPITITGEPIFAGGVKELQTPLQRIFLQADFLYAFLALLAVGIASFTVTMNRLELSHLFLFGVAALAGGLALRNLPIFGIIAVPLVALNLQRAIAKLQSPAKKSQSEIFNLQSAGRNLIVVIPAALLVMVFTRGVNVGGDHRKPAFGYDERIFPVQAADFIAGHETDGNIFSTMEYNGYFIWRWFPQRRVFVDGRLDVFGSKFFEVYGKMLWSSPLTDSVFRQHDINCCILPQPPSNSPAMRDYLGRTLGMRPDWTLVYWDDLALIYVRNIPAHEQLIAANGYHAIVPTLLGLPEANFDPQQFLAEAQRSVTINPTSSLALTVLGVAQTRLSRFDEAKQAFEQVLQRDPAYSEALVALGMVYMREQNLLQANEEFEKVLRLEPDNSVALYNLGYSHFHGNEFDKAESFLTRALDVNPGLVPAYIMLGDIYYQRQQVDGALQMWQTALSLDPQNQTARSRLDSLRR